MKGLLAIALAFLSGGWLGYRYEVHATKADKLRSEIAALKVDLNIAKTAEVMARAQVDGLDQSLKQNQEKVDALFADLSKRAVARKSCSLSDRDARRLRDIR